MPRKTKTLDQVTAMQAKAVHFLRYVKGDEDAADEFEQMSPEEYAAHKHVSLVNNPCSSGTTISRRLPIMAKPTRAELEDLVKDQQDQIDSLNDKLDTILAVANDEEDIDVDDDSDDDENDDSEDE